jgi:hypothetical protein
MFFGITAGLTMLAALPAQAVLVGYYQFDNATNIGFDSSGLGNNLISTGPSAAYTSGGLTDGGLSLGGSGNLTTSSGAAPSLFPLGNASYTLDVSFKTVSTGARGLIGWGNYGSNNQVNAFRLNGSSNGGLNEYWWANDLVLSSPNTTNGVWHTAISSFDGTTRRIYLDGALVGSDTPGNAHNVTSQNFAIGRTLNNEFFVGTMDNVAVFDTALTPVQAQSVLASITVPEPRSLSLLGVGLLALGLFRSIRKRSSPV